MKPGKIVILCLLGLIGLIGIFWGAEYLGIIRTSIFAPMRENVRREVFENTQSYVEGKRQELTKYRMEYLKAKDEQTKAAIQMTVTSSCVNLDIELLKDVELQRFLTCMRNNQTYVCGTNY